MTSLLVAAAILVSQISIGGGLTSAKTNTGATDATRTIYAYTVGVPAFTRVDIYVTTSNGTTVSELDYVLSATGYVLSGAILPLGTIVCSDAQSNFHAVLVPEPRYDLTFVVNFLKKMPDVADVSWYAYDANGKSTAYGVDSYDKSKRGPTRWYNSMAVEFPSAVYPSAPPLPSSCFTTPL
jgi:hypothetical protein